MENICLPIDLVCEFLKNPIGLSEKTPRLSWKMQDSRPDARQTAYQIVASCEESSLDSKADLWKTGWVKSGECLDIEWEGKPLKTNMKVYWKVRLKDSEGKESPWSEVAFFEMGYLKGSDWVAQWITDAKERPGPSPYFRKSFELGERPVKARLHITARGIFEASLNGSKVGSDYFVPGWTEYTKRIHALTYDVTEQLQVGENVVGVVLGDGWFSGNMGNSNHRNNWGNQLSLLAEIEIEMESGEVIKIVSGEDWKFQYGAVRESDIYNGETIDTRLTLRGWNCPGYEDSFWEGALSTNKPSADIIGKPGYPVRKQEEMPAIQLTEPQYGVHVFDFGQNMVGLVRVKIYGHHYGDAVVIRYAEMLQADGMIYTENLRGAKCTDTVYCNEDGEIIFEPKFTFHGFQFVEVTGLRRKPDLTDVTGIVLHTEIPSTGHFECSEPLINKLQHNIVWGQKGNFFETPTDCPQRDERLGWTGDAQIFVGTAAFNRDVASFFEKYCEDMEDSQFEDGRVPHVVPNPFRDDKGNSGGGGGQAAWADAVVICPWVIYLCYGNKRILERRYESMKKFVDWRDKTANNGIHSHAVFGDWLSMDSVEGERAVSPTPGDLIATAYFAKTTEILAKVAGILGKSADAKKYNALFKTIKEAFINEFFTPSGRIVGDNQCSYLLALGFGLFPENKKSAVANYLIKSIERWKWHLSTGFVGTPLLAPVLTSIGRNDVAYKLLLNQTYPSWIYPILQGATTMWERWNSYTKEKGFGNAKMNSFNHYAYGAIGEWMVSAVAGLSYDEKTPGYKHIVIQPQLGEGITWAKAELMTRYGKASSAWEILNDEFVLRVEVPANTFATIILPNITPIQCVAGQHELRQAYPFAANKPKKDKAKDKTKDKAKAKKKVKNKDKDKTSDKKLKKGKAKK